VIEHYENIEKRENREEEVKIANPINSAETQILDDV